jgi:protein-tyrosine phosphatase
MTIGKGVESFFRAYTQPINMSEVLKTRVLFVCMGNICRSPTAEGVFRHFVAEAGLTESVDVDSAGTHAYHRGEPSDQRASEAAKRRGYSLADIHSRKIHDKDFDQFDYVIAMDRDNLAILIEQSDAQHHDKISLFLEHSAGHGDEVPDPYYGGSSGFERVLDLVEEASRGLLETLQRNRG